jgi:aspartate carbamoyltransferase regulatory subunit
LDIEKGFPLAVNAMVTLMENFKRMGTHTEKDFKIIINLPSEYKENKELLETQLTPLKNNEINYLVLATEDTGNLR